MKSEVWGHQRTPPAPPQPHEIDMASTKWARDRLRDAADPQYTKWLAPLLLIGDALLCALIVWKVPYTEIDWRAYMEQVESYLGGERDYIKIQGGTGPLVYPAGHLYIYRALYALTDQGRDIFLAQIIFGVLYLGTLGIVMACYRQAKAPPYIFPLLVLSKRLHSIYLLRLFNDCFAVGALFLAIYAYQRRIWTLGSAAYTGALAIKMSVLLALPAIVIIIYQGRVVGGYISRVMNQVMLMLQVQVLLALPFLQASPQNYLARAFEFTRQFLFKWTVNWRFVGEDRFLSKEFSISLLVAHLTILLGFVATRWIQPSGRSLPDFVKMAFRPPSKEIQQAVASKITPSFILTTVLTSNAIGMLCARSLHYQFYSWLVWGTPFLLWKTGLHPVVQYAVWACQEWAWNVYPSTDISSAVVVGSLFITVVGVWLGTGRSSAQTAKHTR